MTGPDKFHTYFAIRDLQSGKYLPESGGAYTWWEPTDAIPPRLFLNKRAAASALGWWRRGVARQTHGRYGGAPFSVVQVVERQTRPVEIVEVHVVTGSSLIDTFTLVRHAAIAELCGLSCLN